MKRLFGSLSAVAVVLFFIVACQKETSFETGGNPADATLQSDISGDCLPKNVAGVYEAGTALNATNFIEVDMDVAGTGDYTVYTDTVNGVYFRVQGTFTAIGYQTLKLLGFGTPAIDGSFNFRVRFQDQECVIPVDFLPDGAGGPAVFTLTGTGSPASCSGATPNGQYIIGSPLTSANTVPLTVNVTQIGTYSITTTAVNGMTFTKSGVFLTTGSQTVTLVGSGTPTGTPGAVTVPVTAGASTCNFTVTTVAGATYTFDCAGATVNGTYEEGVALNATNTIDIDVNVTSAGPYNISSTINGMTFTASGTFTVGATTITLIGAGTPTADGTFNLPLTGATPCTVPIVVDPGATPTDMKWSFKDGSVLYEGTTNEGMIITIAGATSLTMTGDQTSGSATGLLALTMTNSSGGISTGNYSGTAVTGKLASFTYSDGSGDTWVGSVAVGTTLSINLTTFDQTNKIIEGTFSGTVKAGNGTGATKTITEGKFKAKLE